MLYINSQERNTHNTLLSPNTMQKFTTDRYDGQRCQVSIVSSSITIQGENNAIEIRFLDEAYLLDAICSSSVIAIWTATATTNTPSCSPLLLT